MEKKRLARVVAAMTVALVVVVASCQSAGQATVVPAPTPVVPTPSANQVVIWGEVPADPSCSCDHPDYLGRVDRSLAEAKLDRGFTQQKVNGQWQLFTVAFDPRTVSTQQVRKIIEDGGGKVVSVAGGT